METSRIKGVVSNMSSPLKASHEQYRQRCNVLVNNINVIENQMYDKDKEIKILKGIIGSMRLLIDGSGIDENLRIELDKTMELM